MQIPAKAAVRAPPSNAPRGGRWQRILRLAATALVALVFGLALRVLAHELRDVPPRAILAHARSIRPDRLVLAVLLTCVSYVTLTLYDYLGLRYAGHALPYRRSSLASFIAYVFSHNVGFATVSGTALRYRIYSAWGLSPSEIAKTIAFTTATFALGLSAVGGVALAIWPPTQGTIAALPPLAYRALGCLALAAVAAYLIACARSRRSWRISGLEARLPSGRLAGLQLLLSGIDGLATSGALYSILEPSANLGFGPFLAIFVLAATADVVSHVPAGLGIVESVFVVALSGHADSGAVVAGVLVYRAVYYLLPLVPGLVLLATLELGRASPRLANLWRVGQH